MSNSDGDKAFRNEGHQVDFTREILSFEVFLNALNVLENHSKCIFTPLNVLGFNDYCLTWAVRNLNCVIHWNLLNVCLSDYFFDLASRCQAFILVLGFDKNSEWENFSLLRIKLFWDTIAHSVFLIQIILVMEITLRVLMALASLVKTSSFSEIITLTRVTFLIVEGRPVIIFVDGWRVCLLTTILSLVMEPTWFISMVVIFVSFTTVISSRDHSSSATSSTASRYTVVESFSFGPRSWSFHAMMHCSTTLLSMVWWWRGWPASVPSALVVSIMSFSITILIAVGVGPVLLAIIISTRLALVTVLLFSSVISHIVSKIYLSIAMFILIKIWILMRKSTNEILRIFQNYR